ncbi:uncharacterized protein JCM15063_002064 [Sporobolomyces koalae]|uniref:uncharacterized protein n=1 Tax=Sporobolomyces koalae TaxID=500713 RepID=UPI0031805621
MVALSAKKVSLPHLSLSSSRNNSPSPSRANSLSSVANTPTSTAPTSPAALPSTASSSFFTNPLALDRKKSKSTSPKLRPVDPIVPADSAPATSPTSPRSRVEPDKDKAVRRSSFGASLSAFSAPSSRSSSPATKSSSIPAGLSLTPASAQLSHDPSSNPAAGTPMGGLKPLQVAIAKSAGAVKDRGGALLMRSKSSDRAADGMAKSALTAESGVPVKKKTMMGTMRGLALGQSVSQPAQSRSSASSTNASAMPNALAGSNKVSSMAPPLSHSGTTTPTYLPHGDPLASLSTTTPRTNSHVHQLAESHVSQISLRLSETVNKVFMPSAHGTAGVQADKLEGTFFVPSSAVQEATGGKGRPCPRVIKSREFGEMLVSELHAAAHDSYLLRTILRSSVLKALSLFLSRLSALLLVPTSVNDPHFRVPLSLPSCKDPKLQESDSHFAAQFPLPLRYNLHIVRCAITVKQYMLQIAAKENGFPAFVEETLRPWRAKLTELIGRVMTPVVTSFKNAISDACKKSRIEGGYVPAAGASATINGNSHRGRANSGDKSTGSSALGLNIAPAPSRSSSQSRSLSLGRSGGITPLSATGTASSTSSPNGPVWLQEAGQIFDICTRLFQRLDAKTDTDRWAVGIAIAAIWKGMLGCSARIISQDGLVPSTQPTAVNGVASAPVKNRLLGGVKKTPSPPPSPPLPAVGLANTPTLGSAGPSPATVAFVRLISDLELFEHRLLVFLSATLSSPQVVLHPSAAPVDPCPGAPACGLCKTGRTFDEESDSSDEDDHGDQGALGKESRLALSAMREAMQALSSMIVVVRASRDLDVIGQALQSDTVPSSPSKKPTAPLTPSDLFALGPAASAPAPTTQHHMPSLTIVSPTPAHPQCPTLRSAIIDLHPLILLHLMLSRLPRSLPFQLPHEIWALRGEWDEYENELRGFAAAEEWAGEIAWEIKGEIVRVRQESGVNDLTDTEKHALKVLEETVERVSRDSA